MGIQRPLRRRVVWVTSAPVEAPQQWQLYATFPDFSEGGDGGAQSGWVSGEPREQQHQPLTAGLHGWVMLCKGVGRVNDERHPPSLSCRVTFFCCCFFCLLSTLGKLFRNRMNWYLEMQNVSRICWKLELLPKKLWGMWFRHGGDRVSGFIQSKLVDMQ